MATIYDFSVKDFRGYKTSLEKYRGKVVLIVNVASQCKLTDSNYTQLKDLLSRFHERGFEIAAFPCNQFKAQEPACELDIKQFVQSKFGFEPDLFAKIEVNGEGADPFYKWLTKTPTGSVEEIKWNFAKFLVDRSGQVVKRYAHTFEPKLIAPDIEALL